MRMGTTRLVVKGVEKRLLGAWRSDRKRTVKHWVFPKRLAAAKRRRFEGLFGKLVLRFTPKFSYSEFDGEVTRCPYRVLWAGPSSCVVLYDEADGQTVQHIHFEYDHIYVLACYNVEFFRKVTPNRALHRTASRRASARRSAARERRR